MNGDPTSLFSSVAFCLGWKAGVPPETVWGEVGVCKAVAIPIPVCSVEQCIPLGGKQGIEGIDVHGKLNNTSDWGGGVLDLGPTLFHIPSKRLPASLCPSPQYLLCNSCRHCLRKENLQWKNFGFCGLSSEVIREN